MMVRTIAPLRIGRMGSRTGWALGRLVVLVFGLGGQAGAAEGFQPALGLDGMLDLQAVRTDEARSWQAFGPGKLRFGGNGEEARTLGRLSELSVVGKARLSPGFLGVAQAQHRSDQERGVDLVQAFGWYQRALGQNGPRLAVRGGLFFPPISLEHDEPDWNTQYSITPSAINSWIGEELRILGVESALAVPLGDRTRLAAQLGAFRGNDPLGIALSFRGWALHDIKMGLDGEVELPAIGQAVNPIDEADQRTGFYGGVSLRMRGHRLRVLRYDNRADETAAGDQVSAWDTRFTSIGLVYFLPFRVELHAQWLRGTTQVGETYAGEPAVKDRFSSGFTLLTRSIGRHRLTMRYEQFEVDDLNGSAGPGDNRESGSALTLAYGLEVRDDQTVMAEVVRVNSDRARRAGTPTGESLTETQWQVNYRLRF